jgi:hypothetical protein
VALGIDGAVDFFFHGKCCAYSKAARTRSSSLTGMTGGDLGSFFLSAFDGTGGTGILSGGTVAADTVPVKESSIVKIERRVLRIWEVHFMD